MKFELSPKEIENNNKWTKEHLDRWHDGVYPYTGAIGGMWSWVFTPFSLGTGVRVECIVCKGAGCSEATYMENITDYDDW